MLSDFQKIAIHNIHFLYAITYEYYTRIRVIIYIDVFQGDTGRLFIFNQMIAFSREKPWMADGGLLMSEGRGGELGILNEIMMKLHWKWSASMTRRELMSEW